MPRVLMTADAVGGVWTSALELARALADFDLSVTLATMGPPPTEDQLADAASVPGLQVESRACRLEWMPDAWADVDRAGEWLLDLEVRLRPSLVHLNGFVHGALPWRSPVVVAGHSCVCSWNEAVGGGFDPAWYARYRELVARGLAAADAVVAPSHAMLDALCRHYGPLPHASVVPNGRSPRLFEPAAKERFVFAAGRLWDPAKNIASLSRVAPRLPWPVVIAGDASVDPARLKPSPGDECAPTRSRADTRSAKPSAGRIDDNVTYLGRLSARNLSTELARASIVALPARYEPFGLLALEGALAGCALVLGDIASQREIWGDAALFVDPDDDEALEAALRNLIADAGRLRNAAERARQRALTYSPERMAAGYRAVYDAAGVLRAAHLGSVPCAS
jgi:glycogen synthase